MPSTLVRACGLVDSVLDSRSVGLGLDSHCWSCIEVLGKRLILLLISVGVVVQWLDYVAVTQEPGVRFPAKKVPSHVAPP